jgi:hypothetical protein
MVSDFASAGSLGTQLQKASAQMSAAAAAVLASAGSENCPVPTTLAELEAARKVIDDAIARFKLTDLQSDFQKQNQTITTISNTMKKQLDTARNAVNNVK